MPELPEVETVKNALAGLLLNQTIEDIFVFREKNVGPSLKEFLSIKGEKVLSLDRKGKYLIFHLTNEKVLVGHLRMEGKFFFRENEGFDKFDLIVFKLSNGFYLCYNDVRKFGGLSLYREDDYLTESPLAKLGKEPWDIEKDELHSLLQAKKKTPIKAAIMDQSVLAGLGNIYADETLFAAKIDPREEAKDITLEECERILVESRRILKEAIELGGSTIKSWHPQIGVDGMMQNRLYVYGHKNEDCPRCGFPMHRIEVGGRGTTYCPHCQTRKKYPFTILLTGPIHSGKSTAAKSFASKGYSLIDCDQIVKELYTKKDVLKDVKVILGKKAVLKGVLNKEFVREKLGKDKKAKKKLEAYLYPLVKQEVLKRLEALGPKQKALVEVQILPGSGLEDVGDYNLVILSSKESQEKRLRLEGKPAEALLALNKDWPERKARLLASQIVFNTYPEKEISEKLEELTYLFD